MSLQVQKNFRCDPVVADSLCVRFSARGAGIAPRMRRAFVGAPACSCHVGAEPSSRDELGEGSISLKYRINSEG